MLYISILNNITLLVSLTVIYSFIIRHFDIKSKRYQLLSGLLFGAVAVIGMMSAVTVSPGIVFDGRSIVLAVAGLIGGPITAAVAVLIALAYRINMGGAGMIMGVLVIVESALIGTLVFYLRKRYRQASQWYSYLATGILVHLVMLALTAFLPESTRMSVLPQIFLPVILIYPLAMLLMVLLFRSQESQRQLVAQLAESEEKFRLLITNQSDLVVKVDSEGRLTFVNPAYCDMFGIKEEDLLGKEFLPLVHEDDRELTQEAMKLLHSPPYTISLEQRALTRHGWRWFSWVDTAVLDDDMSIKEIIGVGRDISERKAAEKEIIEARLKAEEGDRLKTAFLNNLSHEIRTPLNAIVGFSELVSSTELPMADRQQFSAIIHRSSSQLLALIDDILDMASIEAGEVRLNIKETNVSKIIEHVCHQFSFKAARNGVTLKADLLAEGQYPLLKTDETKLIQILTNLTGNAIKFTKNGTVIISCRETEGEFLFTVRDTGIGIPAEAHDYIFERFRQAETLESKEYGGTGLGLSISRSYVELLGGRIWVESEEGKGSAFHFTVPVSREVGNSKLTDNLKS
jgi:PAS domain S-box-containing protein